MIVSSLSAGPEDGSIIRRKGGGGGGRRSKKSGSISNMQVNNKYHRSLSPNPFSFSDVMFVVLASSVGAFRILRWKKHKHTSTKRATKAVRVAMAMAVDE